MQTCGQIMTKDPISCIASDTVTKAAKLMRTQDVGSLPVIESQASKKLVGIVTDRDIVMNVVAEGRDVNNTKLQDIMTVHPVTCREDDNLQNALDSMAAHQIRRIPVVDMNDRLVGIIAQADVATKQGNPAQTAHVVEK